MYTETNQSPASDAPPCSANLIPETAKCLNESCGLSPLDRYWILIGLCKKLERERNALISALRDLMDDAGLQIHRDVARHLLKPNA